MATYKIGNRTETYYLEDDKSTYLLDKGKTIEAIGSGIYQSAGSENVTLDIRGTIDVQEWGVYLGANESIADGLKMKIADSGKILSDTRAIEVHASDYHIENDGKIVGVNGIRVVGIDGVIENSGEIIGTDVGIVATGLNRIVNSGRIQGEEHAIVLNATEDGAGTIVNSGRIEAVVNAIQGSSGEDRVVNSGVLKGDVYLNGGDDTFVFNGGKVTGEVYGWSGNDKYIVNAEGLTISETSGGDSDIVKASISFTLPDYVETLFLTGKANIDGTGNDQDNYFIGNAGKNVLRGEGGVDMLNGLEGNDKLFGGDGADVFASMKGGGRDTIMDFEIGIDEIQLGTFKGIKDFDDMLAHHVEAKNGDVWINAGQDSIILKDIELGDLIGTDFTFGEP